MEDWRPVPMTREVDYAPKPIDPDFMNKIADERSVSTVEDLLAWLEGHNHPAMAMEPMF